MAMGPVETDRPWRTEDIAGMHRFLQRVWRAIIDESTGLATVTDAPLDDATSRALHRTIAVVRADVSELRCNTAIARLIELTSVAAKIAAGGGGPTSSTPPGLPRALAEPLVLMVAPFAPHIAEELWSRLGHAGSLAYEPFPVADERLAADPVIRLPVQINSRTRFTVDVPAGAGSAEIESLVRAAPEFASLTRNLSVQRLVIVPGRIANVVAGNLR
jgi:leucyl-tRNA synthetase